MATQLEGSYRDLPTPPRQASADRALSSEPNEKLAHNLGRCLAHGLQGFHCWVGWGVIAGNLAVLGRT